MEGRPISDLKVAELRKELEKRHKDKTGVKQVLLDRLKETLEKDGHDPQTFRFRIDVDGMKTDQESSDLSPVNGDGPGVEKVELTAKRHDLSEDVLNDEYVINEHPLPKKVTEETVPDVAENGDSKNVLNQGEEFGIHENKPESSLVTQQVNESCRNLWISNLPKLVKAADLKQHFSKAGKVVSATVVMSTRTPGGCFGFIQMASAEDAASAARAYDLTDFGGSILRVEATERKAPIQSNKLGDKTSVLNKLKSASGVPDSRHTASRSLISRRRYIANRRRQLRRITINNAILRERQRRSDVLSADNRSHSIKKTAIEKRIHQLTRPKYRMSRDNLRPRVSLGLSSRHKSISQRQSTTRISINQRVQSLSQRRPSAVERRLHEPYGIHNSTSISRQLFLPNERRNSNFYPENDRRYLSPPSRLTSVDALSSKKLPAFRSNRLERNLRELHRSVGRDLREPYRPVERDVREPCRFPERDIRETCRPALPERKRHLQSPSRSYESSRFTRNTQSTIYAERNTFKSVCDGRSRQSHLVTRSGPDYVNYNDFDSRKVALGPRSDICSQERYRTHDSHQSEMRSNQLRSDPPTSRMRIENSRREYRAVSRSPPKSRDSTMMRPYPVSINFNRHRTETNRRSRSPPIFQSVQHRPEILEYGHRSEPRTSLQSERRSKVLSSPSQSFRPTNHAFFLSSAYENRNLGRRYQ
uniref:Scaffold attachment factor B n=1 Tax=Schistosoma japonicum TaxID=6182 RepID=C1LG49_SCHJA|nr:Scaffold attachment factor B [Schistosoma japonicum]